MPVDEPGDAPQGAKPPETKKSEVEAALQSTGDEPLPPAAERIAERDADRPEPRTPQGRHRRWLTRRNAFIATLAIAVLVVALILVGIISYRLGYVDRYVANQIKSTLAEYGIRAEIKEFHTAFGPRSVEMRGIELYDAQTNERLGKIDRMLATVRIEDLYALNLRRNINLESLEIDGLELWVRFDKDGRSNFGNLKVPPEDLNRRILFSYSTANIRLNSGIIHYGDERHQLSGEARNLRATIQPDDPAAPAESRMNTVTLSASDSTFVYDGRPINNIGIEAKGRVNQTRAEIQELVLRSPVAEARLKGTMDDWRALRYQMEVTSMVDLTQTSEILQTDTALRGTGNLAGTVSGEGTRYTFDGQINSDALAADNIRLQALKANARVSGDGKSYQATGRVVADLLTAGDFQLNAVQVAGNVMGTGTDFSWVGDLRAAAARTGGRTITGLILSDVRAESQGDTLSATASRVTANGFSSTDASAGGINASDVRVRSENGVTTGSVANVQAGTLAASGARVQGVQATGVDFETRGETTNLRAGNVKVGGITTKDAKVGSLNIAGVRLAIRGGRIEGTSGDINAGTVAFTDGRAENVRLARPSFTVEPSGRYRASADLSLGGGVLGQFNLGPARAAMVATNNQIQLNNFTAEIFKGRASGDATLSTNERGTSHIAATFSDLDIGGLIALSGRVVPVAGRATGTADLRFPGTNVKAATGDVRAEFQAETGTDASGRTPVNGTVALHANQGTFQIEQAALRTGSTELNASGQFSFTREETDLKLDLASTDAAEFQNVVTASGLFPGMDEQLERYGIGLGGRLAFNGTVRGRLDDPTIDGRASVEHLLVQGRDLGALSSALNITPDVIRATDGRLTEPDGGGAQFTLTAPRRGENNIELNATLDRVNAANLLTALSSPGHSGSGIVPGAALKDFQGDLSGNINVTGLPDAMNGRADLRVGAGSLKGEPFESITARATFTGSVINLENLEARLNAGLINATGTIDRKTEAFNINARATDFQLDRLESLAINAGTLPQLTGVANLNIQARGEKFSDFATYDVNIDGEGRDVTVNGRPAGTLSLIGRTQNKIFDLRLTTGLLGQPQVVSAQVNLGDRNLATTVETTLTGADLTSLFTILLPQSNVRVTGRATGTLRASGNLRTENEEGEEVVGLGGLKGTANFTDLTVQIEDIQLTAVSPLLVQFSQNEVFFERTQFTGPGTNIQFGGTAALGRGGRQALSVDGQLNLRVLNSLSPNIFLSGTAEAAVRVGGTYEQPRLSGTASVTGASIATLVGTERLTLQNVKALVRFNSNQASIDSLTATLGGGRVTASGGALLEGFTLARFRLNVRGDDVTVPYPEGFRTTADADLDVSGSTREQIVTGTVNLRRAEYTEDIELANLINNRREASLTEGSGAGFATTQLDLRVEGRDALVVNNNLADMVGSVSLRVVGPVEDPIISGRISATRGTLNFRNDRYELTRAFIDLPPRRDADPLLNIQAESEIRGYTVVVSLTGPLSQPQATVRSDPSLPQADVVALITTGNLSSGDTSTSTLAQTGLGTAASLLTDTLINAPARRATDKLFGLNRFEIDPLIAGRGGSSPTARLTVGRQINKNLSITYSTNVTSDQNQVLALEYRVSNRLSFVARYEQGSINGFSSRNDNFSFEIRFRKRF